MLVSFCRRSLLYPKKMFAHQQLLLLQLVLVLVRSSTTSNSNNSISEQTTTTTTILEQGLDLPSRYSIDCSFPVHYTTPVRCFGDNNYNTTITNEAYLSFVTRRQQQYEYFISGCRQQLGRQQNAKCYKSEKIRMEMNRNQPQLMVNYTRHGFRKMIVPTDLLATLQLYYESSYDNGKGTLVQKEIWPVGSTFTNHWASPTYLIPIQQQYDNHSHENKNNERISTKIYNHVKIILEAWTGMEQKPVSIYGIRQFTNGAIVSPHVTRLPLITSCIIPISIQQLENDNGDNNKYEPWLLEVYDRSGYAVNISLVPGEMLLIESSTMIHGRPFPFKGQQYAELYVHFEPTGQTLLNSFHPPYLVRDSMESHDFVINQQSHHDKVDQQQQQKQNHRRSSNNKSLEAHIAAGMGDVDSIIKLGQINKRLLQRRDSNGWQPIHEAVRGNSLPVVQMLIEQYNVDVNARASIYGTDGHTPYSLAIHLFGTDMNQNAIAQYLQSVGGKRYLIHNEKHKHHDPLEL